MTDSTLDLTIPAEIARRKARLDRLYVKTPEIDQALELVHALRTGGFRGPDGSANCLLVAGPTNSGKTRLFRSLLRSARCPARWRPDSRRPLHGSHPLSGP